jgi:hypothetical protein
MIQKKIFTKGINSDTTDELLPNGMDRYRLNVRVLSSDGDSVGAIETVNGNSLVSYSLPAGTNKCIGAKEYTKLKKIYYFVYNSNANHCILEYNIATNIITLVLQNSGLNFSLTYLITGIVFIERSETSHLMYWTDNYNDPRKINIEKAKYHSAGNYTLGYPNPFDITWITRIKIPAPAPSYVWTNDATKSVNRLLNKNFQFKIQYVFDDSDVSSYSPFSQYQFPYCQFSSDDTYTCDNQITISFNTGSAIVKKIRIAGKETNETDFSLICEIDKEILGYGNDTVETFEFFNDGVYLPIDVNESVKLFDLVPKLSQSTELISGNRLVDGLITEGFDQVDVDFELGLDYQIVDNYHSGSVGDLTSGSYLKAGESYTYGIVYYDFANRSGTANLNLGDYNVIQSDGKLGSTLNIPFLTQSAYTPAAMNYAPEVSWNIYNSPPSWATHYQIVRSKGKNYQKYFQFVAESIAYYDANFTLITDVLVDTPYIFKVRIANIIGRYKEEQPASQLVYGFTKGDRIRMISNPPYTETPWGVPAYYLLDGGTPTASSSDFANPTQEVINLPFNDYEILDFDAGIQVLTCKIARSSPFPTTADAYLPGCLYEIYTPKLQNSLPNEILYEIGEMYEISTSGGQLIHEGSASNQIIVSGTVTGTTGFAVGNTISVTVPNGHGIVLTDKVKVTNAGWNCYAEVTTSNPTSIIVTLTYAGSGTYSGGTVTVSKAATGIFTSGDSFRPYQWMPYAFNAVEKDGGGATSPSVFRWYCTVENMDVNNYFNSKSHDYARVNKYDPSSEEITRLSTIYYSEPFVPETNINGLSTVYDTSFETYEDKYGGIYKLYAENQRLIVFQELKVGAVPVNQIIYNDMQGVSTVGASAEILNPQMIYFAGEFGIGKNPESFANYGLAKYFFDVNRGAVCRLSNDGITPISSVYFLHNNTTDQCEAMLKSTSVIPVFGVYDVKFKEYIVAIPRFSNRDKDNNPAITVAFSEDDNAWSTFYSYNPDFMCGAGMDIISFKSGALYVHNQNTIQNNFYGVQYDSRVKSIMNDNPSNVKVIQAISEESDEIWFVESILTPGGQESSLATSDFETKEGNQYAPFFRDVNTPNLTAGTELFEGDPLRDRVFEVNLMYDGTTPSKLYAVNYLYELSERSNK